MTTMEGKNISRTQIKKRGLYSVVPDKAGDGFIVKDERQGTSQGGFKSRADAWASILARVRAEIQTNGTAALRIRHKP
jgi:hypothetical protein